MERTARVVVTGAGGHVGRALRPRLHGPDLLYTDLKELDVARSADLIRAFVGADVVLHLATRLRTPGPTVSAAAESVRYARNITRAALRAGVPRVVLLSSVRAAPLPELWRGRESELGWPAPLIRAGRAIERLGRRSARRGLDVIVLQLGGVLWPDHPYGGLERSVWLSHEDLSDLVRCCIEAPLVRGRCATFVAVSDTRQRVHEISNPVGWTSKTRTVGLRRRAHLKRVQLKSVLKTFLVSRRLWPGTRSPESTPR